MAIVILEMVRLLSDLECLPMAKCVPIEASDVSHASTSSVHTTSATLMRRLFRFKGYIPTRAKIYFAFRNCTIIYCAGDTVILNASMRFQSIFYSQQFLSYYRMDWFHIP